MAQKQTRRASSRKPIDSAEGGELPKVTAPLDVKAQTTKAEKMAQALSSAEPWIEREVSAYKNKKKIQAKRKAVRDQLSMGEDPEKDIEGLSRYEQEAYLDSWNYYETREFTRELEKQAVEVRNKGDRDLKEWLDQSINEYTAQLESDEEVDTALPMLEKKREQLLKGAKQDHVEELKREAQNMVGTIVNDVADEGEVTPKMVSIMEERMTKSPGVDKVEGMKMLVDRIGKKAVEQGRPELLDGFIEAGYTEKGSATSDTLNTRELQAREEEYRGIVLEAVQSNNPELIEERIGEEGNASLNRYLEQNFTDAQLKKLKEEGRQAVLDGDASQVDNILTSEKSATVEAAEDKLETDAEMEGIRSTVQEAIDKGDPSIIDDKLGEASNSKQRRFLESKLSKARLAKVERLGQEAVRESDPSILTEAIGNQSEMSADVSAKVDQARHQAELARINNHNAEVANKASTYENMVPNGEFTIDKAREIQNDPKLKEMYSTDKLKNMLARSRRVQQDVNEEEVRQNRMMDAFWLDQSGMQFGHEWTKSRSAKMFPQLVETAKKKFAPDDVEDKTSWARQYVLEKAASNGVDVTFPQVTNTLKNGATSVQNAVAENQDEAPENYLRASRMWRASKDNEQMRTTLTRSLGDSSDVKEKLQVSALYYDMNAPDASDFRDSEGNLDKQAFEAAKKKAENRAYFQTSKAMDTRLTPDEYAKKSELKTAVNETVDTLKDSSWLPGGNAEVTPRIKNDMRKRMHRFARLTGDVEQARQLAQASIQDDYAELDGVLQYTGGKGVHPDAEKAIQHLKGEWHTQFADALDMDPEELDKDDITWLQDPDNPGVLMPTYKMIEPLPQYTIDLDAQKERFQDMKQEEGFKAHEQFIRRQEEYDKLSPNRPGRKPKYRNQ